MRVAPRACWAGPPRAPARGSAAGVQRVRRDARPRAPARGSAVSAEAAAQRVSPLPARARGPGARWVRWAWPPRARESAARRASAQEPGNGNQRRGRRRGRCGSADRSGGLLRKRPERPARRTPPSASREPTGPPGAARAKAPSAGAAGVASWTRGRRRRSRRDGPGDGRRGGRGNRRGRRGGSRCRCHRPG